MPRFGGEAQSAVLAPFHNSWALQTDIFDGMSQSTAATVANGTFALHFYNRMLLDEFKGVRAMFAIFVFGYIARSIVQALFFGSLFHRFGVDIVGRHGRHRRRRSRSGERAQCRGLQDTVSSNISSFREHLELDKGRGFLYGPSDNNHYNIISSTAFQGRGLAGWQLLSPSLATPHRFVVLMNLIFLGTGTASYPCMIRLNGLTPDQVYSKQLSYRYRQLMDLLVFGSHTTTRTTSRVVVHNDDIRYQLHHAERVVLDVYHRIILVSVS